MKKQLFYFIAISILFYNCSNPSVKPEKVWVYMELEVIVKKDTTAEYLFGQIKKSTIKKIKSGNNKNYLFELTDARYIDEDDEILVYADDVDAGILYYRTKDIVTFEILKKDPLQKEIHQKKSTLIDSIK